MPRKAWTLLLLPIFAIGCQQPEMHWPPAVPPVPDQMKQLDQFVGSWTGTCEFVKPTAEEMRKMVVAEDAKNVPDQMSGEMTAKMEMNGRYLRTEGWHDFGGGSKSHMVEYYTYDPAIKKFRTWYFGDTGEFGSGTMTPSKDGKTFTFAGSGFSAEGQKVSFKGSMTFVGNDLITWEWSESMGLMEIFKIKGNSKRKA